MYGATEGLQMHLGEISAQEKPLSMCAYQHLLAISGRERVLLTMWGLSRCCGSQLSLLWICEILPCHPTLQHLVFEWLPAAVWRVHGQDVWCHDGWSAGFHRRGIWTLYMNTTDGTVLLTQRIKQTYAVTLCWLVLIFREHVLIEKGCGGVILTF